MGAASRDSVLRGDLLGSASSCDEWRAGEDGHPLRADADLCVRRDDAAHQYYQGALGQSQNAAHRLDGERQLFYAVVEGGQRAQEPAGC